MVGACVVIKVLRVVCLCLTTAPTGLCDSGYFCMSGANVSSPAEGFDLGYIGDTCVDDGKKKSRGSIIFGRLSAFLVC